LREALEVRPDFPEAYYNIANAYLDLGLLEKSIEAYTRALECKPDYLEACINMGRALELVDKSCEALKFYQRALKLAPDDAKVQNRFNNLKEKLESKII
jgi:tetratricopeptide (TPR) repeat protein